MGAERMREHARPGRPRVKRLGERDSWIGREFARGQLSRTVSTAAVVGVLQVVLATSFAALIFSGPLARHLGAGVGLSLFATAVVGLVIALTGTRPGTIASMQGRTAAVTAIIVASVDARVARGQSFPTIVLVIGLSSVLTGVVLYGLGRWGLGGLVKFVPHPVVGGFLAGTGWLLAKGGFGVMTGTSLTVSHLSTYWQPQVAAKWGSGLGFAVLLALVDRRARHHLAVPVLTFGGIALFYAALIAAGGTPGGAQRAGWLLGHFPGGTRWGFWMPSALAQGDWSVIPAQAAEIASLVVVALLAVLFSAMSLETILRDDVDLNRELRAAGLANVAAGVGGAPVGFHFVSFTAFAARAGARSRLVGVLAAMVCVVVLVSGGSALTYLPRPVLGGSIAYLGLTFVIEWIHDARLRLPRGDYLVVVAILGVIAVLGLVPGVAVGMLLALALFVLSYSRTDPVRHAFEGGAYQSSVERPDAHRPILRSQGRCLQVLELQGFLFFGTAARIIDRIRARAEHDPACPLRFTILDFRRVTGLDASAIACFHRAWDLAVSRGFTLVLTDVSDSLRRGLEREGLLDEGRGDIRVFKDLDHGLEWCEDQILQAVSGTEVHEAPFFTQLREELGEEASSRLANYLSRIEMPAGRVVMRQGDDADGLYFLESGRVTVQVEVVGKSALRLATVGPGAVIGEMALYVGDVRTASVVTDVASTLHHLSLHDVRRLERDEARVAAALHRLFAGLLAHRLAETHRTTRLLD